MMGAILKKKANCLLFFAFYFFVGLLVVQSSCTPLRFAYANLTPSNFYTGRAGSLRDTAHLPKSSLTDSDCIRNPRRFFPPLAFDIFTGLVFLHAKRYSIVLLLRQRSPSPEEPFLKRARKSSFICLLTEKFPYDYWKILKHCTATANRAKNIIVKILKQIIFNKIKKQAFNLFFFNGSGTWIRTTIR